MRLIFYFWMSYIASVKKNKSTKVQKNKTKPIFIADTLDIVIYHDRNSLVYNRVSNEHVVESLSNYFSEIFNKYLTQDFLETKIIPDLKELVPVSMEEAHVEKAFDVFYGTVILSLNKHIQNCENFLLKKYNNSDIRKQFFDFLLDSRDEKIYVFDSAFYAKEINQSISNFQMCTAHNGPEDVFLSNIHRSETNEYKIVVTLLVEIFANLISNIISFFKNYQDLCNFIVENNHDNLLYEIDASNKFIFVKQKEFETFTPLESLIYQDILKNVFERSKYPLKDIDYFSKIKYSNVCPDNILRIPLDRFYFFDVINLSNETEYKENKKESESMNATKTNNSLDKKNSCKNSINSSPINNDDFNEKFASLKKLPRKVKKASDTYLFTIYLILDFSEIYTEILNKIKTDVLQKISNAKECKRKKDVGNTELLTYYETYKMIKIYLKISNPFAFIEKKIENIFKNLSELLRDINLRYKFTILHEKDDLFMFGIKFVKEIYSGCEANDIEQKKYEADTNGMLYNRLECILLAKKRKYFKCDLENVGDIRQI